jgi:NAD(P)-dependent dehydrogenase (short-subunit alcohol dehydrogenase family)
VVTNAHAVPFDLSGHVAVVTGAGQNIGAQIALVLAAHGAAVGVNDLVPERASAVADQIQEAGGLSIALPADITNREDVAAMVASVESSLGPVDILVNNAGVPSSGIEMVPFVENEPSSWDSVTKLNIHAVLACSHAVLPGMIEGRWGRIVTIVSDAGRAGQSGLAVYSAAKAAAMGFTRAVAKEVGRSGVTVNCVSLASMRGPDEPVESYERRGRHYPVGRVGTPQDVAPAVLYLVSPAAEWVTGQTLGVDGGFVMN